MCDEVILLEGLLEAVRRDPSVPVMASIRDVRSVDDAVRRRAISLIREASIRPEVGLGESFQEPILERAIRLAKERATSARKEKRMSDESTETLVSDDTIVSRNKRYTVGETFKTVGTMGLKPTETGKGAVCAFQFSRKTGKQGVMDLPSDTPVRYVGSKNVYDGVASSKRMIFRVAAGTVVLQDGVEIPLDHDVDVAGVVNHIDPDDPYNVAARANEAKRLERANLKAQAEAAKKASAA